MSIGLWLLVAIGAFLALSLAVGLALGLLLARISEVAGALTIDPLAMAPPRPDMGQAEELAIAEEALAGGNRGSRRIPSHAK